MVFFATVRRQSCGSLPRGVNVPALRAGSFALYAPTQAITRFTTRPDLQGNYDAAAASRGAAAAPSSLFGLLTGTQADANYFARDEGTAWLADMARGICCPRAVPGDGLELLVHDAASNSWREVGNGEPLAAASYLYNQPAVGLQTLYQRTATLSSYKFGGAERVRSLLEARDGVCWISRAHAPLSIARILPKNMPLADKQRVLEQFSMPGDRDTADLTRERDIRLLLFLTAGLEHYFERFWLGFRRTDTPDTYVCHSFIDGGPRRLNTFGIPEGPMVDRWPPVHGLPIAPPNPHSQAADLRLPPAALFAWHYLQCVLKKFAHADYRGVPGIRAPPAEDWFDTYDFDYDPEEDFDWTTRLRRAYATLGRGAAGQA